MSNYNHSGNVDSVMYHHNNNSLNGHHGGYESSDQQYMHQSFSQPVFNKGNNNNIDTYSYVQYISHKQPQFNLYDYDYEYKAPTSNTTNNVQLNSSSYFSQPVSHSQQQQQQPQQQHHHSNHPRRNQSFNYHSSSGRHHGGIMEKKPSSPVFLHNGSTHMNGVNSASSAFLVPSNNVSESSSSNQRSSPIKSYNELMEGLQRQYQHQQQQYLYAKYFSNSTNKHSGTSTLTRNHHNRKSPPQQLAQIKESFGHGISNGIKSTTSPTKAIVGSTGQYFQSGGINIRFAVNGLSKFSKSGLSLPLNKNIQAGDFGDDAGMIAENSRCIVIGLADGAGGNRNIGIDPQRFSRSLLGYCVEIIKNESIAPTQMAKLACRSIHILEAQQIDGSGTLCLLALDKQTNVLHALNIGDSGFRVVRQGNIVEKSNATMAGSSPKQLYVSDSSNYKGISFINEGDIAQDSDQRKFHVRPGDLIILSSDGLYDVVEDEKIERIVRSREENDLQGMADDLLSQAMKSYIHTQRDDILVMVCKIESKDH